LLLATAFSLPAQRIQHSIPMEVVHGKPYVMVMVNGRGPFRFVVDTGTGGQALVTPELADKLSLPGAGQGRLTDPTGQGQKDAPVVLIESLQIAGVGFTGIKAIRHTLFGEDGSCDGVLGFTLFRDYLLTLDYPNRRLGLASGSLTTDRERSVVGFRMPDGVPIVTLHVGELRVDAQLDSGGEGLSLPEQLASHLQFAVNPVLFANGQTLSTRFQIKAAKLASSVRLGKYTFPEPIVEINPAFPLANFGSCPMQNFALTFDQKNLLVQFEAARTKIVLSATPSAVRLVNSPPRKPPEPGLVPVG
jgi:predicted aspartyl protease